MASEVVARVVRGARLRCPRCGRKGIYAGFWRLHDACPSCGADFVKGRGEFTGAMMLAQFVFTLVALYGYWFLTFYTATTLAVQVTWVVVMGLLVPVAAYRYVKGAWLGMLYAGDIVFEREADETVLGQR